MVRRLTPHDALAVYEVASLSFPKPWTVQDFRYFLEQPSCYALGIANSENTIVAYFLGLLVSGDLDIVSIATVPEMRRQGLGDTLLSHAQRDTQVQKMLLEVDTLNESALNLYKKHGFKLMGVRKKYYENTRDAYFMTWVK